MFADVAVGPTVAFGGQSTNADDDVSAGVVGLHGGDGPMTPEPGAPADVRACVDLYPAP